MDRNSEFTVEFCEITARNSVITDRQAEVALSCLYYGIITSMKCYISVITGVIIYSGERCDFVKTLLLKIPNETGVKKYSKYNRIQHQKSNQWKIVK
jgi:hypothetical protein